MNGSRDPTRKVREPGSGTNGTVTTTLGGDGGAGVGARWDRHGGACDRNLSVDERTRHPGDEKPARRSGRTGRAWITQSPLYEDSSSFSRSAASIARAYPPVMR